MTKGQRQGGKVRSRSAVGDIYIDVGKCPTSPQKGVIVFESDPPAFESKLFSSKL
jgi:hypothetical protein